MYRKFVFDTPAKRALCFLVVFALISVTTPVALANGNYEVELVVSEGKKSVETDAVMTFTDTGISVTPDKANFKSATKTFAYSDIKTADYSFAKKPMLSGGGAVATAILLGLFVVPFLFIKKKKHWMTVQSEKEYAVIKLGDNNWRQINAEMETHGVKVNTVLEEKEKK